jgi:hypothetical protein
MFVHRHGEIRDRTFENQRYRASGLNLAIAAIILWNTIARLGAHHLQWRLRLAIRTAQGGVSAAAKSALRLPRCRLAYGFEQILR